MVKSKEIAKEREILPRKYQQIMDGLLLTIFK